MLTIDSAKLVDVVSKGTWINYAICSKSLATKNSFFFAKIPRKILFCMSDIWLTWSSIKTFFLDKPFFLLRRLMFTSKEILNGYLKKVKIIARYKNNIVVLNWLGTAMGIQNNESIRVILIISDTYTHSYLF